MSIFELKSTVCNKRNAQNNFYPTVDWEMNGATAAVAAVMMELEAVIVAAPLHFANAKVPEMEHKYHFDAN